MYNPIELFMPFFLKLYSTDHPVHVFCYLHFNICIVIADDFRVKPVGVGK